MSVACHVLPLDDPGIDPEGPWTLKVHVRHGVVRAKAWPAGKAEPKDWQVTRYTGSSALEPRVLTVLPGAGEAAHVTRLAVRGSKPATALYLKSDEPGAAEKKQVVELAQQTTTLVEQAEFVKALEAARGCVEASKKAFGPDHAFTATCVNNLGGALHAAGKYDDALKAFEEGGAAGRRGAPPGPGRDGAARPGVRRGPAAAQLPGPDRVQPLEGALRPRAEDGLLTAREVGEMDLWGTDLVVLAACKTGVGEIQIGEGAMGLRRAFQQAGARTVVTSLWSVDDGPTAALLPRFLGHYLAGMPKAEALRKAQLEAIAGLRAAEAATKLKKENQAAPFAWAAFVCHGLPE